MKEEECEHLAAREYRVTGAYDVIYHASRNRTVCGPQSPISSAS